MITHDFATPDLPRPLTPDLLALAVQAVERHTLDARDRAELLDMLGLTGV